MVENDFYTENILSISIDENKYINKNVDIHLEICENPNQNSIFRSIINDYHAYIDAKDTCNRRINWIVRNRKNEEILGAIGINSAILALGDRDRYIGWNKEQRMKKLNNIANNYRFAMIFRGIGSQVLSALRKKAPEIWKLKYGDELVMLETLVKPPWDGTVYKASGWEFVGRTKGYSISKLPIKLWKQGTGRRAELARAGKLDEYGIKQDDVVTVKRTTPKLIFVKSLRRNWKRFLLND
jgi:hypothetical protein